ncbi:elongation factor Ts [Patescibacteria group bacterium]|nr:elongation factor Ts [Patescibacteria group bacterium]
MSKDLIKDLRAKTGAGMNDCHLALKENDNDYDKALSWLRKKGEKIATKKQDREIKEGLIEAYIHPGGKVGVLLELGCETDFVAKTDDFKNLAHEIALQIAATSPEYITPEEVPAELIEKEKDVYAEQLKKEGKPAEMLEKIMAGKLDKFYSDICLLKQPYIKDDSMTIEKMLTDSIGRIGENIRIDRFTRYSL